ncbi:hypothetical protein IAD21_05970 [Abditibacteriota bacterium]|nr:hypothetical protein IAD21_05970 [Abditibacteriota bacterium]
MIMARFNVITLEQNALKREKIERRRGPKPVRTSLLWAQTAWLEGTIALQDGRLVFQNESHQWNFDGALLENTKRALDKLAFRALSCIENERLIARRRKLALWRECASLENLATAELPARLVLESLLVAPLISSAAREIATLSGHAQNVFIREMEGEIFPTATHNLARWIVRNRGFEFWQRNSDFPVNLACRLGFEGNLMPAIFQNRGELALRIEDIVVLVETRDPRDARQIAEFWCEARWQWADARSIYPRLKRRDVNKFRQAWREMELKWRSRWTNLWREIASRNLDAARCALQFHELLVDEDFSANQSISRKLAGGGQIFDWCEGRNNQAFELLQTIHEHPDAASLIEFLSELWLEYDESPGEDFWDGIVVSMFTAACAIGIPAARELRANNHLCLVWHLSKKPELLRLAMEWARLGVGIDWHWDLAQLPSTEVNVALLRREAERFFALCDGFPALDAPSRGALWKVVLGDEEKRSLNPLYWRFIRALAPIFIAKIQLWHADNAANLREWLVLWAGIGCGIGWKEAEAVQFCEAMLVASECGFKVMDEAPSRLDDIEVTLETYAYLSHYAVETIEQTISGCQFVLKWLAHGKIDRTTDWWDARLIARKLGYRPRFCAALLLASKRSPGCIREMLPQVESLRRLHLTDELDALEDEIPCPDGELGELLTRFPVLEKSILALSEWQLRAGEAPFIPSGVREVLGREEKWKREADFLRLRLVDDPNAHLQARLDGLEIRLEEGVAGVEVELAEVLEASIEATIPRALRALITRSLRSRLRALCGSVAEELEWNDDWGNALLLACDIESNRKWATKLLRGQSQNASGWQRHVPANENWLREFATAGKNRDAFDASWRAHIGEWELWIERDALQILQMGNRFSTCLSRGGCNAHSTIANALDANKMVVYARRDGQIQARQLWAITNEGKLGGFHVYANLSQAARGKSEVERAFFEFASLFAQGCGLELNENLEAEISEICGASWYDDGLIPWNELIRLDETQDVPELSTSNVSGAVRGKKSSGERTSRRMLSRKIRVKRPVKKLQKNYRSH